MYERKMQEIRISSWLFTFSSWSNLVHLYLILLYWLKWILCQLEQLLVNVDLFFRLRMSLTLLFGALFYYIFWEAMQQDESKMMKHWCRMKAKRFWIRFSARKRFKINLILVVEEGKNNTLNQYSNDMFYKPRLFIILAS